MNDAIRLSLALGIAFCLLAPAGAEAQIQLTVVAREGAPAPGTPSGVVFDGFASRVSINTAGEVLFGASLAGGGVTSANANGVWAGAPGSLELVAREGDPAPGTPAGTTFERISVARLDELGHVAFHARLAGLGVTPDNDEGVWGGAPGAVQLVAREGDPAPGAPPGTTFGLIFSGGRTRLSGGRVAITARLAGPGVTPANDDGFWVGPPGGLQLVAREGDPAPGAPAGALYGFSISNQSLSLNAAGRVTFNAFLTGGGAGGGAVWTGPPGALTLVARRGDPAPGAPPGVTFSSFRPPTINGAGEVAFGGYLSGPGVGPTNSTGFWAGPPGGLALAIREGDPAPGGTLGETIDLGSFPGGSLTGDGRVLLTSPETRFVGPGVDATNDEGVWLGPPGALELLAREGDPAPGAGGAVFNGPFQRAAANAAGQAAFVWRLGGGSISGGASSLWLSEAGGLTPVVRTGDAVTLAPGEIRTLQNVHLIATGGREAGVLSSLNDNGALVFQAGLAFPDEQVIVLLGGNEPLRCDLAVASPDRLWPPRHDLRPVEISGVTGPSSAPGSLTLEITGVVQDEPVDGEGDGDSAPDAVIEPGSPSDRLLLRAERSGNGDGRVYTVSFTASDGASSCSGTVQVGVPKSARSVPVDGGGAYDSTGS